MSFSKFLFLVLFSYEFTLVLSLILYATVAIYGINHGYTAFIDAVNGVAHGTWGN